jgi:hypothetical protein
MDILGILAFYPSSVAGAGFSKLCSPLPDAIRCDGSSTPRRPLPREDAAASRLTPDATTLKEAET